MVLMSTRKLKDYRASGSNQEASANPVAVDPLAAEKAWHTLRVQL